MLRRKIGKLNLEVVEDRAAPFTVGPVDPGRACFSLEPRDSISSNEELKLDPCGCQAPSGDGTPGTDPRVDREFGSDLRGGGLRG